MFSALSCNFSIQPHSDALERLPKKARRQHKASVRCKACSQKAPRTPEPPPPPHPPRFAFMCANGCRGEALQEEMPAVPCKTCGRLVWSYDPQRAPASALQVLPAWGGGSRWRRLFVSALEPTGTMKRLLKQASLNLLRESF